MTSLSQIYSQHRTIISILRRLSHKAVDGTVLPIVRRMISNTADSSTITGTTETNYDLNSTITKELMRAGFSIHLRAVGNHSSPTNGTPAASVLFKIKLGDTVVTTFNALNVNSVRSNDSFFIEAYIVVKSTGSSGTVQGFGYIGLIDNISLTTQLQDIQVNASTTSLDTIINQVLQIGVIHGRTDENSYLINFVVDVMQS